MILVTFFYISIVWIELSCGQAVKKLFKRAWQVQISHYTHVTLRKYAILKNNQMILVSFSCIFNTSLKITSVCSTNTLSSPCTTLLELMYLAKDQTTATRSTACIKPRQAEGPFCKFNQADKGNHAQRH